MSTLDVGDAWTGAALFLASPLSSCDQRRRRRLIL
jgi:hypothetical protein